MSNKSFSREQALDLVTARTDFSLRRHLAHVAAAMEAMAIKLGFESELDHWYIVGLLHDIDWNETINTPDQHCGPKTAEFLKNAGVPSEWIDDLRSHCDWQNIKRDSEVRKALVAIDEVSGFCVAAALMRPTKMQGMKADSVMKKFKDKNFAKNVKREDMLACEEYFGIKLPDLLNEVLLPAYSKISAQWELA